MHSDRKIFKNNGSFRLDPILNKGTMKRKRPYEDI